ncbi:MAG: Maf family protein [Puniceicoccales bacterium]|jgi:septum formation protein|nr:Maf family protein [Puniceicoccales bacterium]
MRFILASASPRRRELLARHGLFPEVLPAGVVEDEAPDTPPRVMVLHNAVLKARYIAHQFPDALVIGADTTVAIDDTVLNKPADMEGARAMLRRLSGREHTVYTGVAIVCAAHGVDESHCVTSRVRFKTLTEAVITAYFQRVDPLDKAGAYGIQEGRELIIADYDEPVSNIMGLPVEFVVERLNALGFAGTLA